MSYKQLRDVIQRIEQVHGEAAKQCLRAESGEFHERLRWIADRFKQWEQMLHDGLQALEQDQQQQALNTWVQFDASDEIDATTDELRKISHDNAGEAIQLCMRLQNQIVTFLRNLAGGLNAPRVSELLLDVATAEEGVARQLGFSEVTKRDA